MPSSGVVALPCAARWSFHGMYLTTVKTAPSIWTYDTVASQVFESNALACSQRSALQRRHSHQTIRSQARRSVAASLSQARPRSALHGIHGSRIQPRLLPEAVPWRYRGHSNWARLRWYNKVKQEAFGAIGRIGKSEISLWTGSTLIADTRRHCRTVAGLAINIPLSPPHFPVLTRVGAGIQANGVPIGLNHTCRALPRHMRCTTSIYPT